MSSTELNNVPQPQPSQQQQQELVKLNASLEEATLVSNPE